MLYKKVRIGLENWEESMEVEKKWKVLFLCTGNSCRSQMAEGWTRFLKGDQIDPYSAGIETHGLNQKAVQVMKEVGVDISNHNSKNVLDMLSIPFDYVITVCDNAKESCPLFPGKTNLIHVGFKDPATLEKLEETEENKLNCYRKIRDEIKELILKLPELLTKENDEVK